MTSENKQPTLRHHYWDRYPPRHISRDAFLELIKFLNGFKNELHPIKRTITVEVFGDGQFSRKQDGEISSMLAPLLLEKIHELKIYLRLHKSDKCSVEALIHFNVHSVYVSVSDIGTEWGAAIRADLIRHLKREQIAKGEAWAQITGLLAKLMPVFLILGSMYYVLWTIEKQTTFLISAVGFSFSGFLLLAKDIITYLRPNPQFQAIIESRDPGAFSVGKAATWLSLISTLLTILEKLFRLLSSE